MAGELSTGVGFLLKKNNVDVIWGEARLAGAGAIEVTASSASARDSRASSPPKNALGAGTYSARNIIIATGARPRVSRDGSRLAFLRGGSPLVTQGNVYVRDLQTGQETQLYPNSNYTMGYDWDLTGTNLVYDWNCWLWQIPLHSSFCRMA